MANPCAGVVPMLTPTPSLIWCSVAELSTILPTAHQIPYTKSMIKQHNGAFLVNETAANDSAVQSAMASYMASLKAEAARRDRIRAGIEPTDGQYGTWHISDRH